jgi:type I restriction enzyme S subunit
MTLDTFFQKFDQFADAPGAVGKLRELVRCLAVQGKLVSQESTDEPANKLIAQVVAALPNKKSENPFLGVIEDSITAESEYELPAGWAWLPLGHVGIWATGCGFPTQYQGETDREFLFCKVSDMNLPGNEVEIHSTVHSIDADVIKQIRARANPVGTVIFPKIGGAIATHKRRLVIKPTIIDNNCSGIQPIGLTDERWLLMLMRNLDLTKYQSGTSVPAVSQGSLDPIRIGLPPLAEQQRIVAKVEELLGLCDRLEAEQAARAEGQAALGRAALSRFADAPTPANLDWIFHSTFNIPPSDLRKAILTLAVQGKLVPQDPADEPAEALIARIALKRQTKKAKAYGAVDASEVPFDIPYSWSWVRLGNLARMALS